MKVHQNNERAGALIEEALGVKLALPYAGVLVEDESGVAGALAFNGFDKHNVDMTVVVYKSWTMAAMRFIAKYVFVQLKCKRVSCLTLANNHRAINRLIRLGFECEGVLKERFPQGDALLFGLRASRQKILRLPDVNSPDRAERRPS